MARMILTIACLLAWPLVAVPPASSAPRATGPAEPAQEEHPQEEPPAEAKGWSLDAGVAGAARNRAGRYLFQPIPFARLGYCDVFEASSTDGVSWAAYGDGTWKAGPLFDLDRREPGAAGFNGRRFATPLGTGGIGGFVERSLGPDLKTRLEVTEGVLARRGVKAELSAEKSLELSSGVELDLGLKARGGTRSYVDSVYRVPSLAIPGVTAAAPARRRGADRAGMTTIGPTAEASYALGKADVLTATLEGDRLVAAAARSQSARGNLGRHSAGTFELGWRRSFLSAE